MKSKWMLVKISIVLLGTVLCSSCKPPAFKGGIRDVAVETFVYAPGEFPVPGVLDYGNAAGPGNGGPTSFEGVTGSFGIDDHPSVAVNVDWTVTNNYATVIFQCGSTQTSGFVPVGGAIVKAVCYMF